MKLNFNYYLKSIEGKELKAEDKPATAGMILAGYLSGTNKNNAIKLWDIALRLYRNEELELDQTDTDMLYSLIETAETLTVLTKAQLMHTINEAKKNG